MDEETFIIAKNKCSGCGDSVLQPMGKKDSPVLLLGDEPTDQDYASGYPFAGPYGTILEGEFHYLGFRLRDIRRMYVWPHYNTKKPECFQDGLNRVFQEARGRKIIILMGAQVVKYFTGKSIMQVSSLITPAEYFPNAIVIPAPSVSTIFKDVGEFRLALDVVKEELEKVYHGR